MSVTPSSFGFQRFSLLSSWPPSRLACPSCCFFRDSSELHLSMGFGDTTAAAPRIYTWEVRRICHRNYPISDDRSSLSFIPHQGLSPRILGLMLPWGLLSWASTLHWPVSRSLPSLLYRVSKNPRLSHLSRDRSPLTRFLSSSAFRPKSQPVFGQLH